MKDWMIKRIGTIGSRFSYLQYWVGYAETESGVYQLVGCADEAQADEFVKRFRDTGKMKNPKAFLGADRPDDIEPHIVMKMHTRVMYLRLPAKGNT